MSTKVEKKIVPRGRYVFVKQDDPASKINEYGIINPDSEEQEQKSQGTVESVGSEIKDIKKGDRVIFGAYAGEEVKVKNGFKYDSYRLLFDEDIIAFLK